MTTSLDLAKKAKEAGIEINPQFHWSKEEHDGWELNMFKDRKWSYFWEEENTCLGIKATPLDDSPEAIEYGTYSEHAPAPTTDEWLEFLPDWVNGSLHIEKVADSGYSVSFFDSWKGQQHGGAEGLRANNEKPADALAKLAIKLKKEEIL